MHSDGGPTHPAATDVITSGRVVLVPIDPADALALVAGRPTDLGGLDAGRGWPHADTMHALRGGLARDESPGWYVTVSADRATAPTIVGDCGTKGAPDDRGRVEIGYGLAAPARGHGYGRDLVRGMTGWLRQRSGVRAVVAEVLIENTPSRRALEAAGYALDRVEPPYVWYTTQVAASPDTAVTDQ